MADVDLVMAIDAIARLATPRDQGDAQRVLLDVGPKVVPVLLRTLVEAGGETARATIETLGLLGDLRAVSPLRRILRRSDPELACTAAEALGHIPHGAAVWALRSGLESAHQAVRVAASLSLSLLATSEETRLAAEAKTALLAIAPSDVGPLVEALLWRLQPAARDIAFARAIEIDPTTAVEAALRHLGNRRSRFLRWEIHGSQHRCDVPIAPSQRLGHHRQNTAQSARDVLRRIEAVHPLIFQLTADTAADILPVLADIGNQLQSHAGDGDCVDAALLDIVTVLTNWYDPEDAGLAAIAVDGMRALGAYAIDVLCRRLVTADADERPYIVSLLRALDGPPQDTTGTGERVAALGTIAIEPLIAELQGADLSRREGAALALARLGWQPGDRVGEYRLAIALGRWDALPRRAAARTLLLDALEEERRAAWGEPRCTQRRDGVDERAPRRIAMVRTLARFLADDERGSSAATRGLLAALHDDPSPPVREEATRALEGRGRVALPRCAQRLIVEALAQEGGAGGESARFRCDLIHLLARRGGHARSALDLLRRLAVDDPSPLVRDAARAAVAALSQRRSVAPDARAGQGPSAVLSLGPRAAADVGQALRSGGGPAPEELARQLDSRDAARVGHAITALVSMGRAGSPVLPALERVLLTASLPGRRAAAQVLDRLGALDSTLRPERPEALAAYHLARGDLAQCEAVGAPARQVLREALSLLDWRSAGAVALSLLRLGEPPWSPALGSIIALLEKVALLPDTRVDETLQGDDRRPAGARDVSLAVSRAADRRAARDLLAALQAEANRLLASPPNASA